MSETPGKPENEVQDRSGLLAWFAENHVAANLLMLFILVAGLIVLLTMRVEVFPEIDPGMIKVSVPYPGASPEEVEQSICLRVEDAIEGIEGIKQLNSVAAEGMGTVVAEMEDYADGNEVLDDVKQAVDQIIDFPPRDAEEVSVTKVDTDLQVISVVVMADRRWDESDQTQQRDTMRLLKETAESIRDELTNKPNISQVEVAGDRPYEVAIELSEEQMQRYGVTFAQVAEAVRRSSLDLPGGTLKTEGGQVLLRAKGQKYVGREFEDVVVLSRDDGTVLRVRDLAKVIDGFEDTDVFSTFDGKPAVYLNVLRVGDQGALDVAGTVLDYVDEKQLPPGLSLDTWFSRAKYLESRMNLLTRNAAIGLVLVFVCLALFLDLRLAFWTTLGIPISFFGGFMLMPVFGVTINMISLFALIVVLGIVVDDAIVVGENVFAYRQKGMKGIDAAIKGVREMASPVTLAILTSVAAFAPLYYTEGQLGKILWPIAVVVVVVLLVSLVEALLILPAHLSSSRMRKKEGPIARGQAKIRGALDWVIQRVYARHLEWAIANRYLSIAIALAVLAVTGGFVAGGHIRFTMMPDVEADNVWATLNMPPGTSVEETQAAVDILEQRARQVEAEYNARRDEDEPPVFRHVAVSIGTQPFSSKVGHGPGGASMAASSASHLGEINIELLDGEERNFAASELARRWDDLVGDIPGVQSLTYNTRFFSAGDKVNVELRHEDYATLLSASDALKEKLRSFAGVRDIKDSFEQGKRELALDLTPQGRAAGLRLEDLARQVRRGFYGEEVQRIQRGRHDIKVMVRYPEAQRKSLADIRRMRIRVPQADGMVREYPFNTVATVREGRGYATIDRVDRKRVVTVTADVDETVGNAEKINKALVDEIVPDLATAHPGMTYKFGGEQEEMGESLKSLGRGMLIALLVIFGLLAVQFRSYVQPVIVMLVIPFGMVGAVGGHLLMGMDLSMLSGFGVVALAGVVVNDSLIMVDQINRFRRDDGLPFEEAVRLSGIRRFRPILLTTLTTFFGLMPMILERSLQARFLVPMAISLGFGVLFATAITLILVPVLYLTVEDVSHLVRQALSGEKRLRLAKAA